MPNTRSGNTSGVSSLKGGYAQAVGRRRGLRPLKKQANSINRTPDIIPDGIKLSPFVFSRRFLKQSNQTKIEIPETLESWNRLQRFSALASQIESDSDGGPTVNANWIKIVIDGSHANAGSNAESIRMRFGRSATINLGGLESNHFPKGWWLSWDLTSCCSDFLETIPTDDWDDIYLENTSGDGILLRRITIVHSGETILDWPCRVWLDGSKGEAYGRIGLSAQILAHKLGQVGNSWIPQIHYAAREIGKSDWHKYGSESAWCSEFAAWCLRRVLWNAPTERGCGGSYFNSCTMEEWFESMGRVFSKDDLLNKKYILTTGDYLRLQFTTGGHSALFIRYLDGDPETGPGTPGNATRLETIEGNTSMTVAIRERTIGNIRSVGSTR